MAQVAVLFALAIVWFAVSRLRRARRLLPPGPKPWPVIGNVLDMPLEQPWETYREWCKTYDSDIIFLHLPMQPTVIVGSVEAATELLERRSNLYSDRPQSVMVELMGWDFDLSVMPYSPRWRAHRRILQQEFHPASVLQYRPAQLKYARAFLGWAQKSPEHTRKLIRQCVTSIIFLVVYGKSINGMNDEYVIAAKVAVEGAVKATVPGMYWAEFLPAMKWLPSWIPGATFKKTAEVYRSYVANMKDKPYLDVRAAVDNGTAPTSWTAKLMEQNRAQYGGTDEEAVFNEIAKNIAGAAYAAAADTTSSAIESFVLAMALFPDVQKRAQAELDRVVGSHRLPEFEDLDGIPYIRAVRMETLRWMPVAPTGVPHAVTTDDIYEGYHIPKGTAVIPNIWAMMHNPKDYPDPDQFKPERFLDGDGNIDPTVKDPATLSFGFGRRGCPGRFFASDTLSIFMMSVLHVFDITAGTDATGKPMRLTASYVGAQVGMPQEVPCGLLPRSNSAARLLSELNMESEE